MQLFEAADLSDEDKEFIQAFAKRIDGLQHAELLRVPPLAASSDAKDGKKKRTCASESLLRGTQCSRLKRVDNAEGVKARQDIVCEKRQNKGPIRVKFAPLQGAGKALKGLLESNLS